MLHLGRWQGPALCLLATCRVRFGAALAALGLVQCRVVFSCFRHYVTVGPRGGSCGSSPTWVDCVRRPCPLQHTEVMWAVRPNQALACLPVGSPAPTATAPPLALPLHMRAATTGAAWWGRPSAAASWRQRERRAARPRAGPCCPPLRGATAARRPCCLSSLEAPAAAATLMRPCTTPCPSSQAGQVRARRGGGGRRAGCGGASRGHGLDRGRSRIHIRSWGGGSGVVGRPARASFSEPVEVPSGDSAWPRA